MPANAQYAHIKGDIAGGLTAALIPLPKAMALGALVFAPLGSEFMSFGIVSGLIALAASNMASAPLGGLKIMNNAPFSLSSFMLLTALQKIVTTLGVDGIDPALMATCFALFFLTVFMCGLFQILLGFLRAGDLAKYIPYPVLAGLLNGSAILIIVTQINFMLGLPKSMSLIDIAAHIPEIQLATLAVGVAVCLAIHFGPKLSSKIPSPFYGILTGTILYYLFVMLGFNEALGPVIGEIPSTVPTPRFGMDMIHLTMRKDLLPMILELALMALGISVIVSLRSLLVTKAGENLTQERANSNRELIAQGVGNCVTGIFGGISTAGSLSSTLSNFRYGGRTALSRAFGGFFVLLVILALHQAIAIIPKVVLAGMLIMIAIESFDKWSFELFSKLHTTVSDRNFNTVINLFLVLVVIAVLLLLGIFQALGVGFILSVCFFIFRMSKSAVKRELTADVYRSNTRRNAGERAILDTEGRRIHVIELQGSLFFGTADKLAVTIENRILNTVDFIILDFNGIVEIDITGAKIISQIMAKCRKKNIHLYLSSIHLTPVIPAHRELADILTREELQNFCFDDLETALAVAEDRLLDRVSGRGRYGEKMALANIDVFNALNPDEIKTVRKFLTQRSYKNHEPVFSQGDPGDFVYFISRGRARILKRMDGNRVQRLRTICPGTVFGEMSMLDRQTRSADVIAVGDLDCYTMSRESLKTIVGYHPELAYKILSGFSAELAKIVRLSDRIITHLKQ